jgi:predicted transcriptional regulator
VEKMAIRALLHMNKLKDFESWLEKQGYMILPTSKNPYEILRAKKDKDTVLIYKKGGSEEHLSIMDKDYPLIRKFIRESKSETNADRIRNMSDEELVEVIPCPYMKDQYDECVHGWHDYDCNKCKLEWLQSKAE